MKVEGCVALVTGTSRGIGPAYVETLAAMGARKIYATTRDGTAPAGIKPDARITILRLDITDHDAIAATAKRCSDVTLLINNAGINFNTGLVAPTDIAAARAEMETNYFGTLAMCRAFASVLKANGGGAIINMLSITARVNLPLMGSLSASKAATLSLTQGVRAELAEQGTRVLAIMPGAVDTDMTRDFPPPKMPPIEVARAALAALEQDLEEAYPGDMATGVHQGLAADPKAVERQFATFLPPR